MQLLLAALCDACRCACRKLLPIWLDWLNWLRRPPRIQFHPCVQMAPKGKMPKGKKAAPSAGRKKRSRKEEDAIEDAPDDVFLFGEPDEAGKAAAENEQSDEEAEETAEQKRLRLGTSACQHVQHGVCMGMRWRRARRRACGGPRRWSSRMGAVPIAAAASRPPPPPLLLQPRSTWTV